MKKTEKFDSIICFSGEDWWIHNPHSNLHLMKIYSNKVKVLYVNSPGIVIPNVINDRFVIKRIFNKVKSISRYIKKIDNNLFIFTPFAIPLSKYCSWPIKKINDFIILLQLYPILYRLKIRNPVIWITSPVVYDISAVIKKKFDSIIVNYCIDNYSKYPGVNSKYLEDLDKEIKEKANLVLFVNHTLFEEKSMLNNNSAMITHGVDYELFSKVNLKKIKRPDDLLNIPNPIIGYMGEVNSLDYKLIKYLSEIYEKYSFVFIGDIYSDVRIFDKNRNVYFLGKKKYEILPNYLKYFDCLCLYYRLDQEFNLYRNPKKLLEYLATGIPIISVNIPEAVQYAEYIKIAKSYEEFGRYLNEAILGDTPEEKNKRMKYAELFTWEKVAFDTWKYIEGLEK
jgi:glycosyltransferase involved in cell wall biosynthesis